MEIKVMYDYLIVGAGLFGAVCARELTDAGKKVLVIDKRNHIGGNCYTEEVSGVQVHKYGPHIFHTNSKKVWDYISKFTEFNNFVNRPKVSYKGQIFSFPINLFTLYQLYNVTTPQQAKDKLKEVSVKTDDDSLEGHMLSTVGPEIYNTFVKGYTTKQWGRSPKNLPSFIIKRLPIRFTYDDNYFNDKYQGIPTCGYTKMFENLLEGIEVKLEVDFLSSSFDRSDYKKIIYTGPIDAYYDYKYGALEYRSLSFEREILEGDFQGNAVVNYTEEEVPYTRIIEHKHFSDPKNSITVVTKEYPQEFDVAGGTEPYYPVNDIKNNNKYKQYENLSTGESVVFGGRLGLYKYYDMDQVIAAALKATEDLCI